MSVWAVSMVKDEADIIASTVEQMAGQVDHVLVADNGSTDGTRDILEGMKGLGVEVRDDPEPAYYQSQKMTALARRAADAGAEWVVAFDADEYWYSPFGRIADVLTAYEGAVATAAIYDHRPTAVDPAEGSPLERIGWRTTEDLPLHKIACRPVLRATIAQGNHGAHYPTQAPLTEQLVIRHYPYRSLEQFVSKVRNGAAAYAASDLPPDQGAHWRGYGQILEEQGEEGLAHVFRTYFWSYDPAADPNLIFDPAP